MKYIFYIFILLILSESTLKSQTYINFNYSAPSVPIVFAGNDTIVSMGTTLTLNPAITGGTAPFSYQWTPGNLLSDSTILSPQYLVSEINVDFVLTVTDVNGCTISDTVNVSTPTGITEKNILALQVYPNPTYDFLIVNGFPKNINSAKLIFFSLNGKEIHYETLHIKNGSSSINVPSIPAGVYLVQFSFAEQTVYSKIIIR